MLTLAFLGSLVYFTLNRENTADAGGYTIRTERAAVPQEIVRVNINTAGPEELQTLPGIGPALAEAIVSYRAEHGSFTDAEELLSVKGIGEAKLSNIREWIVLDP